MFCTQQKPLVLNSVTSGGLKECHMCSTCCALGGIGMYHVQRFFKQRWVGDRGMVDIEEKIVLERILKRRDLE